MNDVVNQFQSATNEIFEMWGVAGVLSRVTQSKFDRITGAVQTPASKQDISVQIKLGSRTVKDDNGVETIIQTAACREELKQGDLLTVAGLSLRVISVKPKTVKGVVISWRADCEGASQ